MTPKRILVIDDEYQITRVLKRSLGAHRYDVRTAADGESGMDTFGDFHPDLVITDLSMPGMGGIEVCRAIRRNSEVPIIVLSVKGEEQTKVEALDAGADDFVTKPFGMNELLARVRASLRRGPSEAEPETVIEIGDFNIDRAKREVKVDGNHVHLTPKEFNLLAVLVRNAGRVVTRTELVTQAWGEEYGDAIDSLKLYIHYLRQKLEVNAEQPEYIITSRGVGYRFVNR